MALNHGHSRRLFLFLFFFLERNNQLLLLPCPISKLLGILDFAPELLLLIRLGHTLAT